MMVLAVITATCSWAASGALVKSAVSLAFAVRGDSLEASAGTSAGR
jgi:hypothetical protein